MNRRKFVLSWGRKLFFGLGWPASALLGLIYLKSYILPTTFADAVYYGLSFIGHYGLINAVAYFLLYCPVVLLMPTYYVARIWSVLLILAVNLWILSDGLLFGTYQLHTYSPLARTLLSDGVIFLPGTGGMIVLASVLLVAGALLWLQGERIWRSMQRRFSNPVSNWYLGLITLCLIIAKSVFHYSHVDHRMSELFPLDFNWKREGELANVDHRKFYYPAEKLVCNGKFNNNLVVITIDQWNPSLLNEENMPHVFHMKKHSVNYLRHSAVANEAAGSYFSLFYSIPSTYMSAAGNALPAITDEINKRQYEVVEAIGSDALSQAMSWIDHRSDEIIRPYFLNVRFSEANLATDQGIQEIVLDLQEKDLLKDTYILLVGGTSKEMTVPFMLFQPSRKGSEINHATSHYDIMPTMMEKLWGCKKTYAEASVGKSLEDKNSDWIYVTTHDGFEIIDFKTSIKTKVSSGHVEDIVMGEPKELPRRELILNALKLSMKFSKP